MISYDIIKLDRIYAKGREWMHPYRPKSNPPEINKALFKIKKAISNGDFRFVEDRRKNMDTLAKLGFLTQNVNEIILQLTYKNYLNGPSDDRDFIEDKKTIWEFGYHIENNPIYIKIKIMHIDNVIGISFHIAEKPLHFHF